MRNAIDFILLAALWGASFLFMRVAAPEFGPISLMLLRCAIGAATLLPILLLSGTFADLPANFGRSGFVGLINSAVPFVLLAFAALTFSTGTLSTLNATAPFWGSLIAFFWLGQRLTAWQMVGLVIGFTGVAVLVNSGFSHQTDGWQLSTLALIAALTATFAYGLAANFTKKYLSNANVLASATGSQLGATLALLGPGIWMWPVVMPGSSAWVAVGLLGIFSTGFAYILYFRLIRNIGPAGAITVTFAIPVFGMLFGWVFLDEAIDLPMVSGAGVIVLGCALTTQVLQPGRNRSGRPVNQGQPLTRQGDSKCQE